MFLIKITKFKKYHTVNGNSEKINIYPERIRSPVGRVAVCYPPALRSNPG